MRFLLAARVTDFRSIAKGQVDRFGDVTPLVGFNGSGKSNLLRALNLFFNDVVETGESLNLRRDFREPGRKVKLRIVVEVDLDYGAFGGIRQDFQESLDRLAEGYEVITFRKEWSLDPVTREQVGTLFAGPLPDEMKTVSPENVPFAIRLLNLVRFRYIPNHVHPSQVLRAEEDAIRKLLFDRLGQKKLLSEDTVRQIGTGASDLMKPIREAMKTATGEIGDVELATPGDWRELAWAFGMKLRATQSQSFETLVHGSGIQSVLAYHVLHAIDTTFSGSFGWRKGAVWAVEEPESFLHARLQGELARSFAEYASGPSLQIVLSTHSPAFLGASDSGVYASLDSSGRSEFHVQERGDIIRAAYTSGIAPFAHPLHTGPPKPLLLVEGKTDRDLVVRAYRQSDFACPYEILCLEDFDSTISGGDETATWLKYNREAVEARPEASPIHVLLDWEARDATVSKIERALLPHATSKCLRWPIDLVNPDLSESWVGIERFLSTAFVEYLAQRGILDLVRPDRPERVTWVYGVEKKQLRAAKAQIHTELSVRDSEIDIAPLIAACGWLSAQLKDAPPML